MPVAPLNGHRLVLGLALLAVVLVVPRVLAIGEPFHFNYNEGWNLYRTALVQDGGQLYGVPPGLWVVNYPPLSFHIAAWLDRLIGDLVLTGRLLSLAGLAGTCLLAGACVAHITASRTAAICAALLPAIWIGLYQANRIAMNDPQLLATAFVMAGVWCYLRAGRSAWLVASAMAVAVGLFTKSNLIDLPLAILLHLAWSRRWRDLAVWTATGAAAGTALLATSLAVDGPHFLAHVLLPRDYLPLKGLRMTAGFTLYLAGALALAVLWGRHHLRPTPRGFLVLAAVFGVAVGALLAPGGGIDRNSFFDALVALAMVVGVALHDAPAWFRWRHPAAVAALVLAPLLPAIGKVPERIVNSYTLLRDAPRERADFEAGRRLLAGVGGPSICENMQLCFAAGQPLDYEPFYLNDLMRRGLLDAAPVVALLRERHWGAVVLDASPDALLRPGGARERFTAPVVDAILATYHPALSTASFIILLPIVAKESAP